MRDETYTVRLKDWVVERANEAFSEYQNGCTTVDEWIAASIDSQLHQVEEELLGNQCRINPRMDEDEGNDRIEVILPWDLCRRIQGAFGLAAPGIVPSALEWIDTLLGQALVEMAGVE